VSVDVLITGVNRSAPETPAAVLARVLGMAPDAARRSAKTFPSMILAGTSRAHAESVAAQLRDAGIKVELVERAEINAPTKPVATTPARAVREVREERPLERTPRHRDMFEERASRTQDIPGRHRDMFEERASSTHDVPARQRAVQRRRETVEERAAPRHRDAAEERAAPRHRDAFEERAAPRRRDAVEERAAPAHRDAFEERASQAVALPAGLRAVEARPSPSPAPVAPSPLPAPPEASVVERAPAAQPAADTAVPAFTAPALGFDTLEPEPFAAGAGFGPLDLDREPRAATPLTAAPLAAAPRAGFGSLEEVFGAEAETARREAKRPTAADGEVEALFEVPSAGRVMPAQPRLSRTTQAGGADSRERLERTTQARDVPLAVTPMSFGDPEPLRKGRWRSTLIALVLLGGGAALWKSQTGHEQHSGTARADAGESTAPATDVHVLVRLSPPGVARSLGVILRQLVDGTHKVQISTDGFPEDTQCLLVRGDDGKRQERLEKLSRTGLALPLDQQKREELAEHQESLRTALGDAKLTFTPICLSVDAWIAQQQAQNARAGG
jgi:hypothetical protein